MRQHMPTWARSEMHSPELAGSSASSWFHRTLADPTARWISISRKSPRQSSFE